MKHQNAAKHAVPRILAIAAAGALLSLGAGRALADGKPFGPPSPERIVAHLAEELDLTAEQEELITPVIVESAARHREMAKKYGRQEREMRREAREERKTVESDAEAQLSSILTAEQMEEFLELKDERRSRERGRRGRGGREGMRRGGGSPDRVLAHLAEELDLTAEQEESLLPIIEEGFEQRRELFESVRADAEAGRGAVRRQAETLEADLEEKVAAVLTAGQMEEFLEMREERREGRRDGRPFGRHGRR